ncbi:hypothetical protein CGW93_00680 [candidate division bacterium WOR-3 4484_18]|uniref:Cell division protein ZapA n=1 Tax=candidate division WOR-3 bacterium 4484_18 TaxID=2020626 RepID=A0A257LVN8_UNCW3|nr:MAG: hypothetical protein CGW93_00680 [candidate division bacterium WOR-3 4484_18]
MAEIQILEKSYPVDLPDKVARKIESTINDMLEKIKEELDTSIMSDILCYGLINFAYLLIQEEQRRAKAVKRLDSMIAKLESTL